MANINKIKLSGTSYDIQDTNAARSVTLTQAEYDALQTKDPNVFYIISDSNVGYVTSAETQSAITQAVSGKQDTFANESVLSGITSSDITNWNGKSDFSGSYNDLTNKPSIPSKTSDLTNDSNFATSGYVDSAVSGKANSSDVYTKSQTSGATEIATALSGKQDTLSAGTNITIVDNVISASGGGTTYSAGTNISIANDTINCTLNAKNGTGSGSIIFGNTANVSNQQFSVAFGSGTQAKGIASIAEGESTQTTAWYCHSSGYKTLASGKWSNAEGYQTTASTQYSHTEGIGTKVTNNGEHSQGMYNTSSSDGTTSGNTLFSVGNGTSANARHNAFEIRQNGDIYLTSGSTDIKLQDYLGGGVDTGTVQTMIDNSITGKANSSDVYTKSEVDNAITAATNDMATQTWVGQQGYITGVDLSNYATLQDIPTVPTSNTAFTNDAQYATSAYVDTKLSISDFNTYSGTVNTAIGNKANSSDVYTKSETSGATEIATALSGKQDTLSAGTNITIVDNVISAEGGSITIDQTLDSGSTNPVANSAITTSLNLKANKSGVFASYAFGETNSKPWIRFKDGNNTNLGSEIYYPKINGKGILTNNGTWAGNNLMFSLVETSAVTSSMASSSTDAEIPSAKCVYDTLGGLKLVKLSQSEYDALSPNYDSNTIYFIKD